MKVCWISQYMATPGEFLKSIIKMTPGRSGKWKDMEAITDPFKADFVFVLDGSPFPIPLERSIFFGEHPKCLPAFTTFEQYKGKALAVVPLDKYLNPGEWWLDYDYDFLSNLKPITKAKNSICVFTAKRNAWKMYSDRVKFMCNLLPKYNKIDVYGRPKSNFLANPILKQYYKGELGKSNPIGTLGEHQPGKEILINYRYTIEFDNGPTLNYFSERFYDALLMWCMPLYWGSKNVHEFLPENSFRYVDIENYSPDEITKTISILESDFREQHLEDMKIARDLLLNSYQLWPYMYNVINNLESYQ
jgi:Glycosyltransferase family 10 (fucosyltransferase) C-term